MDSAAKEAEAADFNADVKTVDKRGMNAADVLDWTATIMLCVAWVFRSGYERGLQSR